MNTSLLIGQRTHFVPFANEPRCMPLKPEERGVRLPFTAKLLETTSLLISITRDAKDYGFQDETVAHVVKDVYSKFRYVYPAASKSGEQCHEDMLHFLAVDDNVKVLYSDNALEFDYAAKQLRCRRNTSRAYVDENKAVIEREIRTILEGTRSNLVQSGLPDRYWPLAAQHHAMCLNITKRLDNGNVPWEIRFGEPFIARRFPLKQRFSIGRPRSRRHLRGQSLLVLVSRVFSLTITFSPVLSSRLSTS